ncbi:hypothetical protein DH2020_013925 [Rehmannia glutinosa]|uniref:Major facilitator superfamily (MFS) profile domain-containing protein n=1 Tax=Rehmannia glutinosa TaxID=99300 RepID=A0ABR0WYY0_REHGL
MSGATIYIKRDLKITDVQIELLVGTINIYSLLGSAIAGRTSDWLGRRITIVFASAIFFIGALVMGFANNYAVLMVGRFVAGLGGRLCPHDRAGVRGGGGADVVPWLSHFSLKLGWRLMLGVGAVPSVFLGLAVLIMPESPRWLVMQGRLGDAKKVLDKTSDSLEEAQLRLADIKEAAGLPEDCHDDVVEVPKTDRGGGGVWGDLLIHPTRPVLHIVIAALGLQFLQQASGIDAVPENLRRGRDNERFQKIARHHSRRCLQNRLHPRDDLLRGQNRPSRAATHELRRLVLSLFTLATGVTVIDQYGVDKFKWLVGICVGATYTAVAFFSMGMGPIAWVYSSEVFPPARARGCGMGVAINRFTSGIILMSFISLYKAITIGGAFYLFTGIAVITWIFFYTLLPETRGRTLEDMEVLFGSFFRWRTTMRELRKKESKNPNDAA